MRDHLEEVEMKNFEGENKEMQMVRFLLGEAAVLKTFLISVNEETCPATDLRSLEMMTRVNTYQKVSATAEVVFSYEH